MTTLLWFLAVLLILVGIIGVVVPAVPGTVAVFLGLLLAAWADQFQKVGWPTLAVLGALTLISFVIDFSTTTLAARKVGASKLALVGAAIGMLVGMFFGFIGLVIGPFVGAFVGELIVRNDLKQAGKAGAGAWLGLALGIAAKLSLVFIMIGIFIVRTSSERFLRCWCPPS